MGLAASQARFLGITARKSNIEYEGQQVNQQRTALAQEVNALYSKLMSVKVPIAPDATDFYETNYSFSVSNTESYDGDYLVKSYFKNSDGTYYLNTQRSYNKNVANGKKYPAGSITKNEGEDDYTFNTSSGSVKLKEKAQNSKAIAALVNSTYGAGTVKDDEEFYYYNDEKSGETFYIPSSAVNGEQDFSVYNQTQRTVTENIAFPSADVTLDANGRMSGVKIEKDPVTGEELNINSDVDTAKVYDTDAYNAALRDYTMSKDEYDKKIADLNAQTESLQQEDKVLEMRLDQIDTEQNELQTELEAVKAVLDKNIEGTFKTFA